jgi:hypothetical protein
MFDNWFGHCSRNEDIRQNYTRIGDGRLYSTDNTKTIFSQWNINRRCFSLYTFINNLYNCKNKKLHRFFSFYADHSNTIINNLRNEYGSGSNFISIIDGFSIIEQRSSQIRNIDFAIEHLQKGYKKVWKDIENIQKNSSNLLFNLNKIQQEFRDMIISEIGNDFIQDENSDLSRETRNTYNENIFSEIYNEMNTRLNNRCRRLTRGTRWKIINGYSNEYFILYFTDNTESLDNSNIRIIAVTKDENTMIYLQHIIGHLLLYSENLWKKFHEFNTVRESFNGLSIENIHNEIDEIFTTVNADNTLLEGMCKLCKMRKWFRLF